MKSVQFYIGIILIIIGVISSQLLALKTLLIITIIGIISVALSDKKLWIRIFVILLVPIITYLLLFYSIILISGYYDGNWKTINYQKNKKYINLIKMRTIFTLLLLTIFTQVFGQTQQIIRANDIKINGNIKLFTSKTDLINKIKKADKIEEDFPGCSNYDEELNKGTKFFIYSKNGLKYIVYNKKAEFQEIDLNENKGNYILIGQHKISNKTTLTDLKKIFPIAYKNYKKEKDNNTFRLNLNSGWWGEIQIVIENEKVIEVGYWTPC